MSVDYKTGSIRRSAPQIAEAVQWVENNAPVIPNRKTISRILEWLEAQKMIVSKKSGGSSRRFYDITICNWDTYQNKAEGLVPEDPQGLSQKIPLTREHYRQQLEQLKEQEQQDFSVVEFSKDESPDAFEPTDPNYQAIPGYNAAEEISYWEAHIKKIPRNLRISSQNAFIRLHQYFKLSLPQLQSLLTHLATDPEAKSFWGDVPTKLIVQRSDGLFSFQKALNHMEKSQSSNGRPNTEPDYLDRLMKGEVHLGLR